MNTEKRLPKPLNYQTSQKNQWGVLIAVPLIGLGIAMGLQSQNSTLWCDRTTPTQIECKLIQANVLETLLGRENSEVDLGILKSAEIIVASNANGKTYKLMLLTNQGKRELTDLNNVGDPEDVADRINDFILDRQEMTLEIHQDDRWFSSAFGGILVLIGLGKMLTFNKSKPQTLPFLR